MKNAADVKQESGKTGPAAKREAAEYSYEEIRIGKSFEFERKITKRDIEAFAALTEDYNPLHTDEKFAASTEFGGTIAHGMLAGSLFSTLVGMHCPGKNNLYLSQSLNFKKPIKPDSLLVVKGTVMNKIDSVKLISIKTQILCKGEVMIEGEAKVKVI